MWALIYIAIKWANFIVEVDPWKDWRCVMILSVLVKGGYVMRWASC